jgi:hypothetical protein
VVVAVAAFFLQRTPVEFRAEEEAPEWEYLPEAESIQAELALLPPLAVAEAVNPPEELRAAEKPQPLPSGSLKHHQARSRNTMPEVAGK